MSESGHHRMRVYRRIRFEYATCGLGNFLRIQKYPVTCGRRLSHDVLLFSLLARIECVHCHAIKNKTKTMQRTKSKNCDIVDDK